MPTENQTMARQIDPFDIHVAGGDDAARRALTQVMSRLRPLDLGADMSVGIELALAEALNNIVEHAYARTTGARPISINGSCTDGGLAFRIVDQGDAMPGGQTPTGALSGLNVAVPDLPEGGFGWFLIRDLAQQVRYRRQGRENHLDLRFDIVRGAAARPDPDAI